MRGGANVELIAPGRYHAWSPTDGLLFAADVDVSRDMLGRVERYVVRVGNARRRSNRRGSDDEPPVPCVLMLVPAELHPDERMAFLPTDVARLERLDFDAGCSLSRAMRPGGDSARMLLITMAFVRRTFPWIKRVSLTDASTVTCTIAASTTVQVALPDLSLCTSGQTWYERAFGARLDDAALHAAYRARVSEGLLAPLDAPPPVAVGGDVAVTAAFQSGDSVVRWLARARDRTRGDAVAPFCRWVSTTGGAMVRSLIGHELYDQVRMGTWVIVFADVASSAGIPDDIHVYAPGDEVPASAFAMTGGRERRRGRGKAMIRVTGVRGGGPSTHFMRLGSEDGY